MTNQEEVIRSTARVISNAFHPYVVLSIILVSIAYILTPTVSYRLQLAVVSLACAYIFPVAYIQTKFAVTSHKGTTHPEIRSFFRDNPREMIIVACLFAIPGPLILYLIDYPSELIIPIVTLGMASIAVAMANIFYRASFHLSIFTSMCISAVILLNVPIFLAVLLIVLLGSSRFYLHQHTPMQLVTGFLIGSVVTLPCYYGLGFL